MAAYFIGAYCVDVCVDNLPLFFLNVPLPASILMLDIIINKLWNAIDSIAMITPSKEIFDLIAQFFGLLCVECRIIQNASTPRGQASALKEPLRIGHHLAVSDKGNNRLGNATGYRSADRVRFCRRRVMQVLNSVSTYSGGEQGTSMAC